MQSAIAIIYFHLFYIKSKIAGQFLLKREKENFFIMLKNYEFK